MACGCNNCNNNPCDECAPKACKCHPCYNTLIGDCKQPCNGTSAGPIDSCMTNEYCDDGCDEFLDAKCVQFSDGENLEVKLENILIKLEEIKECLVIVGDGEIVRGCTDPLSNNYNPLATVGDNSCEYTCPTSGVFNNLNTQFCGSIDLNQFLNNATMGGEWYIGACGDTNKETINRKIEGSILTQISNFFGSHLFNYTVSSENCDEECTEITLVNCPTGNPGNSTDFTLPLNSNSTVNLFDYLTGNDSEGNWYINGVIIENPENYTLNTSIAGVQVFTYKVNEDCCGGSFVNLEFTVSEEECMDMQAGNLTITEGDNNTYNLADSIIDFIPG